MKKGKLIVIIGLVGTAILVCLALFIFAIIGGMDMTDGCLYRYNFGEDKTISMADKQSKSVFLKANGNYSITSSGDNSGLQVDPSGYGKWLNTNFRLKANQEFDVEIVGEVSLCRAYLPKNNLADTSSTYFANNNGNKIPIPRIEENAEPLTMVLDARNGDWRNLTQVFLKDKIQVGLHKDKKTSDEVTIIHDSFYDKNLSADCREGKQAYAPICGRYSIWSSGNYYVKNCKFYTEYFICGTQTRCAGWSEATGCPYVAYQPVCPAILNVMGVAPEPYSYDGKHTLPWTGNLRQYIEPHRINCNYDSFKYKTEDYQNEQYFWLSADNANGLLYRFDTSENPTSKETIGTNLNFATILSDQTDIGVNNNIYQLILNKEIAETDVKYLQFRLNDIEGSSADNTGGYVLNIKHTKCRRTNGNFLNDSFQSRGVVQYAILDTSNDPNRLESNNTSFDVNSIIVTEDGKMSLKAPPNKNGYLWLRILNDADDYKDSFGQYRVQLTTETENKTFYSEILDPFLTSFKGKVMGAAQLIFKNMICYKGQYGQDCTNFFNYIRALLTIYIILYGMMFLLGMVKISQHDLVVRVVKIAIVSGLLNGKTFELFNTYIFEMVTNFSDEIIANMSGYSLFSGSTSISNPLQFMDVVMTRILMSQTFAAQMMAMLSMGINGVLYFIIVFVCVGILLTVLFRSLAVYLMAFMAITVLMGLAPLFLTFILFNRSFYLFDNWIKYTFRYMIEPIILLAGIIILTQLFTIYLDFVVGYSVCWKCALPIKLPFPSIPGLDAAFLDVEIFCINWFAPWGYDHRSSQMGLSMQNIAVLLILAYCLWGYLDFAASVTGRIAGAGGGPSASAMGGAMSGKIENSALGKIGMDAQSRASIKSSAKSRLRNMNNFRGGSSPAGGAAAVGGSGGGGSGAGSSGAGASGAGGSGGGATSGRTSPSSASAESAPAKNETSTAQTSANRGGVNSLSNINPNNAASSQGPDAPGPKESNPTSAKPGSQASAVADNNNSQSSNQNISKENLSNNYESKNANNNKTDAPNPSSLKMPKDDKGDNISVNNDKNNIERKGLTNNQISSDKNQSVDDMTDSKSMSNKNQFNNSKNPDNSSSFNTSKAGIGKKFKDMSPEQKQQAAEKLGLGNRSRETDLSKKSNLDLKQDKQAEGSKDNITDTEKDKGKNE